MHELGMKWRLSTRVAMRIIMTRAHALCLQRSHLACVPFHAALLGKGSSWMTHAQIVAEAFGVRTDFFEHRESMRLLGLPRSDAAKLAVREWRSTVVQPQLERIERLWFSEQACKWSTAHVMIAPPWDARHCRFLQVMTSLFLSKTMWGHARVWLFVLLTGCFPFGVFENSSRVCSTLQLCPWCKAETVDVQHVLVECTCVPITKVMDPLGKTLNIQILMSKFSFVSRLTRLTWSRCR